MPQSGCLVAIFLRFYFRSNRAAHNTVHHADGCSKGNRSLVNESITRILLSGTLDVPTPNRFPVGLRILWVAQRRLMAVTLCGPVPTSMWPNLDSVGRSAMGITSRGFSGRRSAAELKLPPGQYLTTDFPV